jgi:hypothetical protein
MRRWRPLYVAGEKNCEMPSVNGFGKPQRMMTAIRDAIGTPELDIRLKEGETTPSSRSDGNPLAFYSNLQMSFLSFSFTKKRRQYCRSNK